MISILLFVGAFVFFALFLISTRKKQGDKPIDVQVMGQKQKQNYGHIQVFYGSQTGTAAKMAESFAEQAIERGFTPEVFDLKDIKFQHFHEKGQISIFFLSNTGEGQVPDNTSKFMRVLKQKQDLDEVRVTEWKKVSFAVFGLGNTQYEFYNKTGIDVDALLQKKGAQRIYRLGLGDNNASLQDDYIEWKNDIWQALITYRAQNPLQKTIQTNHPKQTKLGQTESQIQTMSQRIYLSAEKPQLTNFRFYECENESEKMPYTEEDLDFKTRASLKSQKTIVKHIHEVRQNTDDGSTLSLQVQLQGQPQYQTAGNISLYPRNDHKIIQQIIKYFNFREEQLEAFVSVQKINDEKKLKLNFVPYCKLIDLLESHIDIQGRLTKSILKKLAKFPSKNQDYFLSNSSPKTTPQFKRITQQNSDPKGWYYLFKIIQQMEVKISFEDFIQLCDSMAPRLFTIGSSYKKQKNVIVMASIIQNGLISKFFFSQPEGIRAQLKKSSFNDAMKWNKVIFISVGTGFAPFRGYLQDKQMLMQRLHNGEDVRIPKVTLFFGCKRQNGDFIYKQQIQRWIQKQVINVFHAAFSRSKQEKVYVQHLLSQQENQIKEYLEDQNSAIYICGSLGMGHQVSQVLAIKAGGHQKVKQLQLKGRIIKELW